MEHEGHRPDQLRTFGTWLKQERRARDLTQKMLAQQVGYAESTIRKIETGQLRASRQVAEQLADALQLVGNQRSCFLQAARGLPSTERNEQTHSYEQAHQHVGLPHRSVLPVPATPLLGRDMDMSRVVALLNDPAARLVTLTGPGGIGKTRLALEVAATVRNHFAAGVWFVELAHLTDAELVFQTIGHTLGFLDAGSRSVYDQLLEYVEHAHALFVLDNFEHLVAARHAIAHLLVAGPQIKIVCTSRVRLCVYGEHVLVVPPLVVPPLHSSSELNLDQCSPAVQLFVQRARAVQHTFQATPTTLAAIARICHRLDGIPLAIELAAARSRVLPPADMLARLTQPLGLLVGGAGTTSDRHYTMRAAIEWSYTLLQPYEQDVFAQLSVFAGGFTLEAAEAVCTVDGLSTVSVLDVLTALVDASFVNENGDQHRRFTMLEVLREYARERLVERGTAETVQRRHAIMMLQFAQQAELALVGPEQLAWLDRLETEHDNIRAAIQWALDHHEADLVLGITTAVGRFWWLRGHLQEGKRWLTAAIAFSSNLPPGLQAKAQYWQGILTIQQGDYLQANALLRESLQLYQTAQDMSGTALALNALGVIANRNGNHDGARASYEQALTLYRTLGDQERIATLLNNLGFTLVLLGDTWGARGRLEESLQLATELGDVHGRAFALNNLGIATLREGKLDEAAAYLRESLRLFWTLKDTRSCAECVEAVADLLLQRGQVDYVVAALQVADQLRAHIGAPRSDREQTQYVRVLEAAQRSGSRHKADVTRNEHLSVEQIIYMLLQSNPNGEQESD